MNPKARDYVNTVHDETRRPFTKYPQKLTKHILISFGKVQNQLKDDFIYSLISLKILSISMATIKSISVTLFPEECVFSSKTTLE